MKNLKSLYFLITFTFVTGLIGLYLNHKDLILPSSKLTGYQVLALQLQSLKNNTKLRNDRGIEQVFIFAHPDNKKVTGPIKNFKKIIKSEAYSIFLDHSKSEVGIVHKDEYHEVYFVKIIKNQKSRTFLWTLITYVDNDKNSFWYTVSVIPYQYKV